MVNVCSILFKRLTQLSFTDSVLYTDFAIRGLLFGMGNAGECTDGLDLPWKLWLKSRTSSSPLSYKFSIHLVQSFFLQFPILGMVVSLISTNLTLCFKTFLSIFEKYFYQRVEFASFIVLLFGFWLIVSLVRFLRDTHIELLLLSLLRL